MSGRGARLGAVLLAACCLSAGLCRAGEPPLIVIRTDDTVYLKDKGEPLVGEIIYQNERELKIRIRGQRISQIVKMADVRRVVPRQNAQEAFERCFTRARDARDVATLHRLAGEILDLDPTDKRKLVNAVKALEEGRRLRPEHLPTRLMLGGLYLRMDENDMALKEGLAAANLAPTAASGFVLAGIAQGRLGMIKEARGAVDSALGRNPTTDEKVGVARILSEIGDVEAAEKIIAPIVESEKRNYRARLVAGLVSLRRGKLLEAESALRVAVEKLQGQSEPRLALGAVLYLRGDLAGALGQVNEALAYGGRARCEALKALIELRQGKKENASVTARGAAVMAPKLGRVAAAKAAVDAACGATDEALMILAGVTDNKNKKWTHPCRDAYVFYLEGHLLYADGQHAEAAASFSRAAELIHSRKGAAWQEAYLAAGAAALKARKYPEAARHYGAAVRLDGDSAEAHAGLGLAYLGQVGRDEDADRELRRALAIKGECLEAYLGLGFLANRHRRETEAIKYFERARGLAGGSMYAAEALEKLRAGRGESIEFFGFDGAGLPTGWVPDQRYGVMIEAKGGQLSFSGKQKQVGGRETRFYVRQDARKFVRMEVDVVAAPTGGSVCGLFLAGTRGFLEIGMFENGKLAWRMKNRGGYSAPADVRDWPTGSGGAPGKVRLGIQVLDAGQGRFRLFADGLPVKDVVVDTLSGNQGYQVGGFCRAQLDESVDVRMDNASLVTRKQ